MAQEWPLSNPNCLGAFYPTQAAAYAGSGFTGVRGRLLQSSTLSYRVYEAAVSFPTADAATAFVAASVGNWKACAGSAVTVGDSVQWTFGDLTGAVPKISLLRTRQTPSNQCQRVLSAVSTIVLDVIACAPAIQDRGSQLADQMAKNVRQ